MTKQTPSKILVVDDDIDSARIVKKALEWQSFEVKTAGSGEQALEILASWNPQVVLLDVSMPGLDGFETLRLVRKSDEYVSVIFLSGRSAMEDVVSGLDAGADDYMRKPFDALELLARVRCQIRIKQIRDDLKRANERLLELVDIDDLTGLYNMRSIYQRVDQEIARARRYKRSVCAIMMDMDRFKQVNDRHDHLFGSYVLKAVGDMIRGKMRKIDFAARYGGDEFLMVLTEIDLEGATHFANRIRTLIGASPFENEGHRISLTASLGLALTGPDTEEVDARGLVRFADRALYKAKQNGRNRVEVFDFAIDSIADIPPVSPGNFPSDKGTRTDD